MSVFIGALAHRHTVVDDAATSFGGASALFVLPFIYELQEGLGDHTLVYVAGAEGVASFILREDGTLKLNSSQAIGPFADIAPVPNATMTRDLVLTGPDGIWRHYEISWAGGYLEGPSMGAVPTVQDDDVLEIGGAQSAVVVGRYVIVTGRDDDGFSVFDLYGWPVSGAVANVDDASDPAYALGGARGITAALVGGRNLVFIAGGEDDGISVFELGTGGAVAFRDSVFDDAALHLDGVESLTTAVVGGVTYLIASGRSSGGLSVFSVDGAGQLASVSNLSGQGLGGATGLSSFVLEGETFVSACGPDDSSLGVFHLGPGGELTDASLVFAAMGSDSAFFFKGAPYVLTTSAGGNSLSVYELGGGNDTLVGGAADDLLLGLRGDDRLEGGEGADRLLGGEGADTLIGGGGDDTYVVDSLGDLVVELAGGGTDRIEASVSVALGAGVENLDLKGSWALNGTGNALDNRLTGNAGDNSLFGGAGADVLTGGAGSDWLDGGESHDEALFQGAAANYLVVHHGGGIWDVVDLRSEWHDATDRLVSIEALGFADRSFSAGSAPSPLTRTIAEDSAWSFKLPDGTMALAGEGALSLTARYCPPGCPSTRRPGRSPARRLRTSPGRSAWRSRASSGR